MDDVAEAASARDAVPILDEALEDALAVQGESGLRALGLLRDARRLLVEPQGWERPYETVVANCRGAMDSLLELSGLHPVGLKSAATDVLLRARALLEEDASGTADRETRALARTSLSEALEVLAGEVDNPGGYHNRRVRHVTERLTRRILGVAEESAARVWSELYARASRVLHGSAVTAAQARSIFEDLVGAAAQVFVALPERAERIKELAGLSQPSAVDASEVAGWVDPRATEYFFVAARSPRWLDLLSAPQLLPEQARWPAWPYLERLAAEDPDLLAGWLRDNFPAIQDIGPGALGQALLLAGRLGIRMAAQVQAVVTDDTIPGLLQMAVYWALDVPLADRDRSWILVVERLIDQVDHPARDAARNAGGPRGDHGLERWDGGQLLTELVRTAYPAGVASGDIGLLRTVCAGLLGRYLARPHDGFDLHLIGSEEDLSHVRADNSRHSFVLVLARAVLDLALVDARAGVPLATRTSPLVRKVAVQGARDRVLATHLMETAPGPATGHQEKEIWWACAFDVAERVVAGPMAHPDQVDLVALLVDQCPGEHRPVLEAALASALGIPPDTAALDQGRSQWQTTQSVPQEWSRLWWWAALLPPAVLQPWQPTLTVLQDLADGSAPDPRASRDLLPWPADDPERLALSDLARTAAHDGPRTTAHRIAAASAATRPGAYAGTVEQLVAIDPVAWAGDAEALVEILTDPAERRACVHGVEVAVRTGTTLEPAALLPAVRAAYRLVTVPDLPPDRAQELRGSLCYLLETSWAGDSDLSDLEPDVLDWLEQSARTRAGNVRLDPADLTGGLYRALNAANSRALHSLIRWGARQARTTGTLPVRLTDLLHAILAADTPDSGALAAIGGDLAFLHARAPQWVEDHGQALLHIPPEAISAARTWLTHGRPRLPLLIRLHRPQLLACLRAAEPDGALTHTAVALLADPQAFGPPQEFLHQLADAADGPAAISALLARLAHTLPSTPDPDTAAWFPNAAQMWRAAATANLPAGSLTGAGTFAYATALDEATWLELTALTISSSPLLEAPMKVAERAGHHPDSGHALAITAALLHHPTPNPWEIDRVRQHARRLLTDSKNLAPDPDRQALHRALVESGDIDALEL